MALRRNAAFWATVLMLLAVVVTFWYVALVLPADRSTVTLASSDLYQEHYPVAKYGGEMLAQGRIPLWNPYQLNGLPFLAVPHSRIFYPPNWLYLWPQTGIAIEVDLVFHWLFAGIGLWLFVRVWGMGHLAGFAAATSFMLSRWLVDALIWPGIVDCAAWLPWTLLLIECAFRGRRWAPSGLALALGLQFTNGATEFILYNGYACALYTALRLVAYARREGTPRALGRLGWLACAVVAGIGLGAVQTLPTLELISQSSRFQGESGIEFARGGVFAGHYALAKFWKSMWSGEDWAATVNDRETPIHRADFLFRAVEVPAGRSSVLFRYEPESFRVGAWISALSALIIAIAAAWSCLPRSRSIRRLSSDIAADRV